MAGRGQLPQPASPQTKQPSGAGLLHTHDPKPLSSSHHGRIAPRLTNEQALTINATSTVSTVSTVSSGALTINATGTVSAVSSGALSIRALSIRALSIRALSIRALIVGVLSGHQQPSQQPLHPTSQHPTRGQGRQQTGRILHQDRRHRRRHPTRRTQHPSRTTSRNTRKHTTFEHTYSIATAPTNRTPSTFPETAAITTKNCVIGASVPRSRCDGPPRLRNHLPCSCDIGISAVVTAKSGNGPNVIRENCRAI